MNMFPSPVWAIFKVESTEFFFMKEMKSHYRELEKYKKAEGRKNKDIHVPPAHSNHY